MIRSQAIRHEDFYSKWYKKWAVILRQEKGQHNKQWQNAAILQALYERGYIKRGNNALGFGVGNERVPSALAELGVNVTATDQDFVTGKAAGWDNGQLTHSLGDLNQFGIASKDKFSKNVRFMNCDMKKINRSFLGKFDIVWSNCALGHLGSIDEGVKFIRNSLDCLRPGGIAVHTTEINVVSNNKTLNSGDTVVFRRKDFVKLFFELREKGYKCEKLFLDFGSHIEDMELGFYPYKDDPLLKLNAGGCLLSQMILIVSKPKVMKADRSLSFMNMISEMTLNFIRAKVYRVKNSQLRHYIRTQKTTKINSINIKSKHIKLNLRAGEETPLKVKFRNTSGTSHYDVYHFYVDKPLVVATANPINRLSKIQVSDWHSGSRPSVSFKPMSGGVNWGEIKPEKNYSADFNIKAPARPGKYIEEFCFAVEGLSAVPDSNFQIEVNVLPK